MKKLVLVALLALVASVPSQAAQKTHGRALKKIAHVVAAPVVAPKSAAKVIASSAYTGIKGVAYTVLFVAEPPADVVYFGSKGLETVFDKELKFDPFKYVTVVAGYVDSGIETAQDFLFATHN